MSRSAFYVSIVLMSACLAVSGSAQGEDSPLFDVPRLEDITVDGRCADWGDGGFRVDILPDLEGKILPVDDLDVRFRLAWDERGLLVLVTVQDDVHVEHADETVLYVLDSVVIFFATKRGAADMLVTAIAPGLDPEHPKLRHYLMDRRNDEALKQHELTISAARAKTQTGYTLEVLLPWKNLGVKPELGR